MTKENLITVPVGTTLEQAEEILHRHRVEKLLVVDDHYNLKGLITVKDIQKKLKYPNAAKDEPGTAARGRGHRRHGRFPGARAGTGGAQGGRAGHRYRARPQRARDGGREDDQEQVAGGAADRRQRGHLRRRARADFARRGRHQGGHRPGLDLHHARGLRRRRAADHGHRRMRARRAGSRRAADCRWRHQVLRRHHQGHRRRAPIPS